MPGGLARGDGQQHLGLHVELVHEPYPASLSVTIPGPDSASDTPPAFITTWILSDDGGT